MVITNYVGDNGWAFLTYGNNADNVVINYKISSCYGYKKVLFTLFIKFLFMICGFYNSKHDYVYDRSI